MNMNRQQYSILINLLCDIPGTDNYNTRTTLLAGIPDRVKDGLNRNSENKRTDLELLVSQLSMIHLNSDKAALETFLDNACDRTEGILLGQQLNELREHIAASSIPTENQDSPLQSTPSVISAITPSPPLSHPLWSLKTILLLIAILVISGGAFGFWVTHDWTRPPASIHAYTFDNTTQDWEFVQKPPEQQHALLQATQDQGHTSKGSLLIETTIWGSKSATIPEPDNDIYTHTAIRTFFNDENDLGKTVSCYLYLPSSSLTGVYFRLFVISDKNDNDSYEYGKDKLYPETMPQQEWIEISMVIGHHENQTDPTFDPGHVNYIGLLIQGNGGQNMSSTAVRLYIDDCTVR